MGFKWLLAMALILAGLNASAHQYQARLDEANWQLDPSPLSCRLRQFVPNYGEAVFEIKSGEPLTFYLDTQRPVRQPGKAKLLVTPPSWRDQLSSEEVADVVWQPGHRPLQLSENNASLMLAQLEIGMNPAVAHPNWTGGEAVTMGVSAVNFQSAYRGYLSCLAGLYPVGFKELRLSLLHFPTNKYGLSGTVKKRLDLIAGYLDLDPSIKAVHVDGHTDSDGRRGHNWELSRLRALEVKTYLEQQGVSQDMIVMKYHGEGSPAKRNSSNQNKAINRRASVRLVR